MEARGPLWFWLLCLCTVRWTHGTSWYNKATANYYVTKKVVREVEFKKYSQSEKYKYLKRLLMTLDDDPLCDDDFYDEEDYIREDEPYYIPEWSVAPYGKVVVPRKILPAVQSVVNSSSSVTQIRSGLPGSSSLPVSDLLPAVPDPSLFPVHKPVDNNLWYRYYKTVLSSGLPVTPYDIRTLIESISASNVLRDLQSPYGPDALYGPFGPQNPLNNRNPLSSNNPNSPYSPFNPDSQLNPNNPHSVLNPYNPESILSPNNPSSPFSPDNLDYPFFDVNNILSLFNPNNVRSPFNPVNLLSPLSPNNPRSPFYQKYDFEFNTLNTDSPFSPLNPLSPLSPINPYSPYNPLNKDSIYNMFNPTSAYNINNPDSPLNPVSPNYYKTFTIETLPLDGPHASHFERTLREETIENILSNPDSPFNVNSPLSPFNPYNFHSSLNPNNPNSILNPLNPNSILSPLNPLSPYNPNNPTTPYYDVTPYDSLFNPSNPLSIFHTENPDSPFNPLNPRSLFYTHSDVIDSYLSPNNPKSPLSPLNPDSILSPLNPGSPFYPKNPRSLYHLENPISPYYKPHITTHFSRTSVKNVAYYDATSPYSLISPYNSRSLLNPNNPESPLSPLNPNSLFSPLNPTSPFHVISENTSPFEPTYTSSLFNPYNIESPYNPKNPNSLLNPNNPHSPFFDDYDINNSPLNPQNPDSILSPYNTESLLSPLNPDSPYNPKLVDSIYNPQYPYSPYYLESRSKFFDSPVSHYSRTSLSSLYNPANPLSPFNPDSPFNPENPLSPYHPNSFFNPANPHSIFHLNSILNPTNPRSPFNPHSPTYQDTPFYNPSSFYNPLNPLSPFHKNSPLNPLHPNSPFNPASPLHPSNPDYLFNYNTPFMPLDSSLYDISNPLSPFHSRSILNPQNPESPFHPKSPYNPHNLDSPFHTSNPLHPINDALLKNLFSSLSPDLRSHLINPDSIIYENQKSIYSPLAPFYEYDSRHNALYLEYIKYVYDLYGSDFPYEQLFFPYAPLDRQKFIDYLKSQYKNEVPPFWPYQRYQYYLPRSTISDKQYHLSNVYGENNPLGKDVPFGPYISKYNEFYYKFINYLHNKYGAYFNYDSLLFSYAPPADRVQFYTFLKTKYNEVPDLWPYDVDYWTDCTKFSNISYALNLYHTRTVLPGQYPISPDSPISPFFEYNEKYNDLYFEYLKYINDVYGPTFPFDQIIFPYNPYARDRFIAYWISQSKDKPDFWPYYDYLWKNPEKFYIYDRETQLSTTFNPLVRDGPLGPYISKYKTLYVNYIKYISKLYGPNYPYERLLFPEASYKARVEFIKCLKEQFPKLPSFWPYPQSFWEKPELIPSTNNVFEIEQVINLDARQIRLSKSISVVGYPLTENSPFYQYDSDFNKLYVDYNKYIVDLYGNNFPYSKLLFNYDSHARSAFIKYLKTQPDCKDKPPKFWAYYPFEYLYYSDSVSLQDFRNLDYPSDFIPPFGPYIPKYNQLYVDYIKYIQKQFDRNYRYETLLFPYANIEDKIAFITYLKSQFNNCPEFWPFATDIWTTPDKITTMLFDIRSFYLNPLNPSAVINLPLPEINPLADVNNPLSPLNPYNLDSIFNPENPNSPLSPFNSHSLLNPSNPSSPFYVNNPTRPLPDISPISTYDPNYPLSPFNPENPHSLFNPNNPLSPFYDNYPVKNSALNPQNPDSILSPLNPFSPLSPKNPFSVYNSVSDDSPYNSLNPLSPFYHESYTTSTKYISSKHLYRSEPVYDLNSPISPYSPYNPNSLLNPKHPSSLLNPRNPLSQLSPDNPSSPFYFRSPQSPILDSSSPFSLFNPNNIESPFNPRNPNSPLNPSNPGSPFYNDDHMKNSQLNPINPKSILSPYNSLSLLSPLNFASPYNPACLDSIYNSQNENYYYSETYRTFSYYPEGPVEVYHQNNLVRSNLKDLLNPLNPDSILNPSVPKSPLSPYNIESLLNPSNPSSPFNPYNPIVPIYDANNPSSLFNPYNPESPFNPESPLSIYNPTCPLYPFKDLSYHFGTLNPDSPNSPLNVDSIYSPLNPASIFSPKSIDSIYNPNNPYSPYSIDHTSVYSSSIIQKTPRTHIVNTVFGTDVFNPQLPAIDDFQNLKSPFNPRNPLSPYNAQSPFNPSNHLSPFNPHSLFNPSNPESPLNPLSLLNPDNVNSPFNPDSPLYPGTPFFSPSSEFNALNLDSPFNRNSLVNPLNPDSPFNINSPLNPLNSNYCFTQRSLLTSDLYNNPLLDSLNPASPFNLNSIFNPKNSDSPFNRYSEFNHENPESPYNSFNLYSPLNPNNPNSPLNPNYVPSVIPSPETYLSQSIVLDDFIRSPYDLLYRNNPFYQNSQNKPIDAIERVSEYYRHNPYKYPNGPFSVTEPFKKYNDKFTPLYLEYLKYIIAKYGDNFPYEQILFPYDKEARVTYVKYLKTCFTSETAPSWFPYAGKYWSKPDELNDISNLVIQYGPYNPLGFEAPFGNYDENFNDLYYNYLLYKIELGEPDYNYEALLFPYSPTSSLNYIDFLKTKYTEKPDWWPYTVAHWDYPYLLYTDSFNEKALFISDINKRTITIDPSSPYSNIAPFYKYDCKFNELYLDYIKFVYSLFGSNFPYEQLFFEYAPVDSKKFIDYVKSQYKDTVPPFWPYLPYQWIIPNSIFTEETFTPVLPYGADNPFGREVPFGPYLPEFNDLYCKYLKYIHEKFGPYFEYDQLLFSYLSPKERVDYYTVLKSKYEKQPSFWPYLSDSWTDLSLISHIPYRALDLTLPLFVDPLYLPDPSSPFAPFYKYDSKYNEFYYDYIKSTYDMYGKDYPYERLLFPYNPVDRDSFLKYLTSKCGDKVPDFWPYYPLLWKHGDRFVKYGDSVNEVTISETVLRNGIFNSYIPKHNDIYAKYIKYINERYGPRFSYDVLFFPQSPLKDRVDFITYLKTQYPDKCPDFWPYPKIFWDKPDQITIVSKDFSLSPIDHNPYNTILPEAPFYKYNPEYNELYTKYLELVYDLYGDDFPYSNLYFPYDVQSRSSFIQYLKKLPEYKDKAPKFWSNYPYEFTTYTDFLILSEYKQIDLPSDFIGPFGPYLPKYKELYVKYIKYIHNEFGLNYPYDTLLFPYASVEDQIEFINYLKSQFDKCPEYLPFLKDIWTKPDILKEIQKINLPINERVLLPYNPSGVISYSNVDDIFNPFSPLNPQSAYSPYNMDSLFDNTNPDSLLNPYNPLSPLSPLNTLSPFYPKNPENVIFDSSNPTSPFNPYNQESVFNPKNLQSVFNPTNPDSLYFNQYQFLYSPISPFNARSLFSPLNPLSPFSPLNQYSPYNPDNSDSIYNVKNPLSPYNLLNPQSPLNLNSPYFYRNLPTSAVIDGIVTDEYIIPYDMIDSYLSPSNVASELSPINPNSILSPLNPSSPFSCENPQSPFNPYNPRIARFSAKDTYSWFNPYNGNSPFNPLHPESPFNPDNPKSPFGNYDQYWRYNPQNPRSPLSPLNRRSLYNPQNPNSLYNPKNKNSVYNPGNPGSPYSWEQTIDTSLVGNQVLPSTPFKASDYYLSIATGLPYHPNSPVFDPFYPDNPLLLKPSPFNPIAPFEEFNPKYQDLYLKYICYIEEVYGVFPFKQLFFPYNVKARLQFIEFLKTKYATKPPTFWPFSPIEWKNPFLISASYEPEPYGLNNPLKALSPFGPYFEKYNELYYQYTEMIFETHGPKYPYRFLLFPYSPKDRLTYINYLKKLCKAIPKWWPYSLEEWNNPNNLFDFINYPEKVILPSVSPRYLNPYLSEYMDPIKWESQTPLINDLPFPNSPVAPFGPYDPKYNDLYYQYIKYIFKTYGNLFPIEQIMFPYNVQARNNLVAFIKTQEKEKPSFWPFLAYQWTDPLAIPLSTYSQQIPYGLINPLGDRAPFGPYSPDFNELYCKYIDYMYAKYGDVYPFEKLLFAYSPSDQMTFLKYLTSHYSKCPGWWPYSDEEWASGYIRTRSLLNPLYAPTYPTLEVINYEAVPINEVLEGTSPLTSPYAPFYTYNSKYNDLYEEYTRMMFDLYSVDNFPFDQVLFSFSPDDTMTYVQYLKTKYTKQPDFWPLFPYQWENTDKIKEYPLELRPFRVQETFNGQIPFGPYQDKYNELYYKYIEYIYSIFGLGYPYEDLLFPFDPINRVTFIEYLKTKCDKIPNWWPYGKFVWDRPDRIYTLPQTSYAYNYLDDKSSLSQYRNYVFGLTDFVPYNPLGKHAPFGFYSPEYNELYNSFLQYTYFKFGRNFPYDNLLFPENPTARYQFIQYLKTTFKTGQPDYWPFTKRNWDEPSTIDFSPITERTIFLPNEDPLGPYGPFGSYCPDFNKFYKDYIEYIYERNGNSYPYDSLLFPYSSTDRKTFIGYLKSCYSSSPGWWPYPDEAWNSPELINLYPYPYPGKPYPDYLIDIPFKRSNLATSPLALYGPLGEYKSKSNELYSKYINYIYKRHGLNYPYELVLFPADSAEKRIEFITYLKSISKEIPPWWPYTPEVWKNCELLKCVHNVGPYTLGPFAPFGHYSSEYDSLYLDYIENLYSIYGDAIVYDPFMFPYEPLSRFTFAKYLGTVYKDRVPDWFIYGSEYWNDVQVYWGNSVLSKEEPAAPHMRSLLDTLGEVDPDPVVEDLSKFQGSYEFWEKYSPYKFDKNGLYQVSLFETFFEGLEKERYNIYRSVIYPPDMTPYVKSGDSFDIVIVGASAAGCVLANRLSEVSSWKILLIEEGGDQPIQSRVPGLLPTLILSDYDHGYLAEPSQYAGLGVENGRIRISAGKSLGGSSATHNILYQRGTSYDFENFANLGVEGWGYDETLKYFVKSEQYRSIIYNESIAVHGTHGLLPVGLFKNKENNLIREILESSAQELGYPIPKDMTDRYVDVGFAELPGTVKNGLRFTGADAYLTPIAGKRTNLYVVKRSRVTKVIIDDSNVAKGVEYTNSKGEIIKITATKEVILTAGAIENAKLLLLSGVGPKDQLTQFNIPCKQELKVGENLKLNAQFTGPVMAFSTPLKRTIYSQELVFRYLINRIGPLSNNGLWSFTGYIDTLSNTARPDLEIHLVYFQQKDARKMCKIKRAYNFNTDVQTAYVTLNQKTDMAVFSLSLVNPKSSGKVSLSSADPLAPPKIDTGLLSDPQDLGTLMRGTDYVSRLEQTSAIRIAGGTLMSLDLDACSQYPWRSTQSWTCYIRQLTTTTSNPVGTVMMGSASDANAVVTPDLCVKGIKGLRVADVSVIPNAITTHSEAISYMIAEKCSDLVKAKYNN